MFLVETFFSRWPCMTSGISIRAVFPTFTQFKCVGFTFSLRQTHGMVRRQQRVSAPFDWCLCPFVLTLFFTPCVKSYKGFPLHALLTNWIKAFGCYCLSLYVCTSIKRRALHYVWACARSHLTRIEAHKNAETIGVWHWHLFVSPDLTNTTWQETL